MRLILKIKSALKGSIESFCVHLKSYFCFFFFCLLYFCVCFFLSTIITCYAFFLLLLFSFWKFWQFFDNFLKNLNFSWFFFFSIAKWWELGWLCVFFILFYDFIMFLFFFLIFLKHLVVCWFVCWLVGWLVFCLYIYIFWIKNNMQK